MNRTGFEFNDTILKVVPTGAYTHEVNLILSDEKSNWKHDIFNDEYSGLEIAIERLKVDINDSNKNLSNYKNQIDKLREKIEKLENTAKKPKDYEKVLNNYGENIADLIENISDTEIYISEKTRELKDAEHKHLVSLNQTRQLGNVRSNYKKR
jgi:predicted  nucleic acid-binding Zn-ribbon protein